MTDEEHVTALLLEWQKRYDSGEDVSAVDLCRDRPDLVARLAERIAMLRWSAWGAELVHPTNAEAAPPEPAPLDPVADDGRGQPRRRPRGSASPWPFWSGLLLYAWGVASHFRYDPFPETGGIAVSLSGVLELAFAAAPYAAPGRWRWSAFLLTLMLLVLLVSGSAIIFFVGYVWMVCGLSLREWGAHHGRTARRPSERSRAESAAKLDTDSRTGSDTSEEDSVLVIPCPSCEGAVRVTGGSGTAEWTTCPHCEYEWAASPPRRPQTPPSTPGPGDG